MLAALRATLAEDRLTQPHWWVLNQLAAAPGQWTRTGVAERLARFADPGTDFGPVFDDLAARGWLTEPDGALGLTGAGEAQRLRTRERMAATTRRMHAGIEPAEYAAALNVLRRIIDNLGGDSDLP
ncbi:MarR family transcriptional regulator [Kitasatospora sp. NPDC096147]|uniref:MarR family transcriptional regulator n=1 Tax=Kitasatospora sp. NPDC096147 TaxID=3364093 RepID=UPI0037F43690